MNKEALKYIGIFVACLCLFGLGAGTQYFISKPTSPADDSSNTDIRGKGSLTSPLLECDTSIGGKEFGEFEDTLQQQTDDIIAKGNASHISVYFRSLLQGPWIGINEKEKFSPASLLKTPVMMTLYKMSETDPTILTKSIPYTKTLYDGKPYFPSTSPLEIGKSYTVDELIHRMIVNSDNEALLLLRSQFDPGVFNKLYDDLKLSMPTGAVDDFMTVQTYASFFRILFNASYLSIPSSEKALDLMTKTSFDKGIVAGVPRDIKVAHKFGERLYTDDQTKQLHDCGIVYHPTAPYLLCIMTRGDDYDKLAGVIKTISKSVWTEIRSRETSPTPTK